MRKPDEGCVHQAPHERTPCRHSAAKRARTKPENSAEPPQKNASGENKIRNESKPDRGKARFSLISWCPAFPKTPEQTLRIQAVFSLSRFPSLPLSILFRERRKTRGSEQIGRGKKIRERRVTLVVKTGPVFPLASNF